MTTEKATLDGLMELAEEYAICYANTDCIPSDQRKKAWDELRAYAERLAAQSAPWIPVSERLPDWETDQFVLVTDGSIVWMTYRLEDDDDHFTTYYTHWQPLPEPPEAKHDKTN